MCVGQTFNTHWKETYSEFTNFVCLNGISNKNRLQNVENVKIVNYFLFTVLEGLVNSEKISVALWKIQKIAD